MEGARRIQTWLPTDNWNSVREQWSNLSTLDRIRNLVRGLAQTDLGDLGKDQREILHALLPACIDALASMEEHGHPLLALRAVDILGGEVYEPLFAAQVALFQTIKDHNGSVTVLAEVIYLIDQTAETHGLEPEVNQTDFDFGRLVITTLQRDLEESCVIHNSA